MAKTLKGRLKLTPLPPDHPLYSGKFVLGGPALGILALSFIVNFLLKPK